MYRPVDWEGWVDVAVQGLPDLVEAVQLVEHVESRDVIILLASSRLPPSKYLGFEGGGNDSELTYPPV